MSNVLAWEGVGIPVEHHNGLTVDGILYQAGMDDKVGKVPAYYKDRRVDGKFWTINERTDEVYGIVGSTYEVIQNRDGLRFLQVLLDEEKLIIENAVSMRGGAKIVIIARRPDHVTIGGSKILPYVGFATSHDGRGSLEMYATDQREACSNGLNFSIKGAPRVFKIRHTRSAEARLQQAAKALQVAYDYTDYLVKMGDEMVNTKFSNREFEKFLDSLVPVPDIEDSKRGHTIAVNRQEGIRGVYYTSENLADEGNTKWKALNAVVEFNDHMKKYRNNESRFAAIMNGSKLNDRALELLHI